MKNNHYLKILKTSMAVNNMATYDEKKVIGGNTTDRCLLSFFKPFSYDVPVLSLNKIFKLPAVSIPTIFLTKTLFLSILFMLDDKTSVIIIGRPSGTEWKNSK